MPGATTPMAQAAGAGGQGSGALLVGMDGPDRADVLGAGQVQHVFQRGPFDGLPGQPQVDAAQVAEQAR